MMELLSRSAGVALTTPEKLKEINIKLLFIYVLPSPTFAANTENSQYVS
jgi:hypothetical protein